MADLHGLISDPSFQSLSPSDQRATLSRVTGDSSFQSLNDGDYSSFLYKMGQQKGAQLATQNTSSPDPGFVGELFNNVVGAVKGAANTILHPIDTAKGAWDASMEHTNEVWNALTGQGGYENVPLPTRASSAAGHLVGSLPVVGPPIVSSVDKLFHGQPGAGAADLVTLGGLAYLPEGAGLVKKGVGAVLPSGFAARAGAVIDNATKVAGPQPIDTTAVRAVADKMNKLASAAGGRGMPSVAAQFIKEDSQGPITFDRGRDFYQNLALSPDESQTLIGGMKKNISEFRTTLHTALSDAAEKAQPGLGDTYSQAIKDYGRAVGLGEKAEVLGHFLLRQAANAAGLGAGLHLFTDLTK